MIAQGAFGLGLICGSLLGVLASMAVVFGTPLWRLYRTRMRKARLRGNARPLLQVGPARAYPGLPSEDGLWVIFEDDPLVPARRVAPRVRRGHPKVAA